MAACTRTTDFRSGPCPVYDRTNCRIPGIVTTCKIVSTTPKLPSVRYSCQVLTYSHLLCVRAERASEIFWAGAKLGYWISDLCRARLSLIWL